MNEFFELPHRLDSDGDGSLSREELFHATRFGGISSVEVAVGKMSASGLTLAGQVVWI
ncbi:hypothetical protein [Desulfuromonas sp. CSMB_57]|jgi:Ca2+-binding EF-hand superfamily protein|uniref:hypothetical protein n=1 Tax=Desulfuromonas sp. CSMB_57 TaxID=2807629 RepID=UPI001CD237F7|nr:hypothetical protein [Desulfuromonas sp. CSMB_57]